MSISPRANKRNIFHASDSTEQESDSSSSEEEIESTRNAVSVQYNDRGRFHGKKDTSDSDTSENRSYVTDVSETSVSRRSSRPTTRGATPGTLSSSSINSEDTRRSHTTISTAPRASKRTSSKSSLTKKTQRRVRESNSKEGGPRKPIGNKDQQRKTSGFQTTHDITARIKAPNTLTMNPTPPLTKPKARSTSLKKSHHPIVASQMKSSSLTMTSPESSKRSGTDSIQSDLKLNEHELFKETCDSTSSLKINPPEKYHSGGIVGPSLASSNSSRTDVCQANIVEKFGTPASRQNNTSTGSVIRSHGKTSCGNSLSPDRTVKPNMLLAKSSGADVHQAKTVVQDGSSASPQSNQSVGFSDRCHRKISSAPPHRKTRRTWPLSSQRITITTSTPDNTKGSSALHTYRKTPAMSSGEDSNRSALRSQKKTPDASSSQEANRPSALLSHRRTYMISPSEETYRNYQCRESSERVQRMSISQESISLVDISYEDTPTSSPCKSLLPPSPCRSTHTPKIQPQETDDRVVSIDLRIVGHKIATPECLSPPSGYMTPTSPVSSLSSLSSLSPETPKVHKKIRFPQYECSEDDKHHRRKVKKNKLTKCRHGDKGETRNKAPKEGLKLPNIHAGTVNPEEGEKRTKKNKKEIKEDTEPMDRIPMYKAMKKQLNSFI